MVTDGLAYGLQGKERSEKGFSVPNARNWEIMAATEEGKMQRLTAGVEDAVGGGSQIESGAPVTYQNGGVLRETLSDIGPRDINLPAST